MTDRERLLFRAYQYRRFAKESVDRKFAEQMTAMAQYYQMLANEAAAETVASPMLHPRFGALKALQTCIDGTNNVISQSNAL
jgi:hypothetical protein